MDSSQRDATPEAVAAQLSPLDDPGEGFDYDKADAAWGIDRDYFRGYFAARRAAYRDHSIPLKPGECPLPPINPEKSSHRWWRWHILDPHGLPDLAAVQILDLILSRFSPDDRKWELENIEPHLRWEPRIEGQWLQLSFQELADRMEYTADDLSLLVYRLTKRGLLLNQARQGKLWVSPVIERIKAISLPPLNQPTPTS